MSEREANIRTALSWWSEIPDKWTPVGWKDHMFRFNIEWNGAIIALPNPNARTDEWAGLGVQIAVMPAEGVKYPPYRRLACRDDGSVIQGCRDCAAPVLWSEWSYEGLLLREEVFAHIPGAKDVETGIEPLFLWVRLSVNDRVEELPLEDLCGFLLRINAPCIGHSMDIRNNTVVMRDISKYPRELKPDVEHYDSALGYRVIEDDDKVRLGIAAGQDCNVEFDTIVTYIPEELYNIHSKDFVDKQPKETDTLLYVEMSSVLGSHIDLLIPMLPTERDIFDTELAIGYDQALAEANTYWSAKPATAAVVDTPEDLINRTIERSLKIAEIVAEKNPHTGEYAALCGSWVYAMIWATPSSMTSAMLLDTMGYHTAAAKYMELLLKRQGEVTPPGPSFAPHPGYLSTPKGFTGIDWLSDHGAILWSAAEHALLSGDKDFIDQWTPAIIRACEFVKDSRAMKDHGGVPGIMPLAVATDTCSHIQAVWNDAWTYKGLSTAARLLDKIGHSRAKEFTDECSDYRRAFGKAIRDRTKDMPVWTDKSGTKHHLVPTSMYGDPKWETRFPFYLDTGPLILVFAGLLDADDELMRSTLLWFREGPQVRLNRFDSHWTQVPCLRHEISSCEPVYSFNVFHSWQLGDRMKFLEGMYSLFTANISQQTSTMCESRGGISGTSPVLVAGYMARLAVVDDKIADNELHLLRLVPLAWLQEDKQCRFENIPTEFGPVTIRFAMCENGEELRVELGARFRQEPRKVVLHVPPIPGLRKITINSVIQRWNGSDDTLPVDI